MTPSTKKQIMDQKAVERSIIRLSHEILERNNGPENLALVGIYTRGEPLARRLQVLIEKHTGVQVPFGTLNITFHRDDFMDRLVMPQIEGSNIEFSIDEKTVVLVDDVLFTGRTIRAALGELLSFGRPAVIQLAVLVDRGHREMPIRADYVGKNIPTHEGEHVRVLLKEVDKKDGVQLIRFENG